MPAQYWRNLGMIKPFNTDLQYYDSTCAVPGTSSGPVLVTSTVLVPNAGELAQYWHPVHAKNGIRIITGDVWITTRGTREKLRCAPVHFTVWTIIFTVSVAKITIHTIKCTGAHRNFSSSTSKNSHVTSNYSNTVFCMYATVLHLLILLYIFVINIFVLKYFFSNIFFQFSLFQGFYLRCLPVYQRQNGLFMYLWYEKYGMQQAVEIGLSSRVMCRVLVFGSYCSHHTRREKFNFSPLLHNINLLLCKT